MNQSMIESRARDSVTEAEVADVRTSARITVRARNRSPVHRRNEPITVGIPVPRRFCTDVACLALSDGRSARLPLQARALDRWPDGSVRWVLLDFQATASGPEGAELYVSSTRTPSSLAFPRRVVVNKSGRGARSIRGSPHSI